MNTTKHRMVMQYSLSHWGRQVDRKVEPPELLTRALLVWIIEARGKAE